MGRDPGSQAWRRAGRDPGSQDGGAGRGGQGPGVSPSRTAPVVSSSLGRLIKWQVFARRPIGCAKATALSTQGVSQAPLAPFLRLLCVSADSSVLPLYYLCNEFLNAPEWG